MAKEIGVYPSFWKLFLRSPMLAFKVIMPFSKFSNNLCRVETKWLYFIIVSWLGIYTSIHISGSLYCAVNYFTMLQKDRHCKGWTNNSLNSEHGDVMRYKLFPRYWPFCKGKPPFPFIWFIWSKLLKKQFSCRWFQTPWHSCDATVREHSIPHHLPGFDMSVANIYNSTWCWDRGEQAYPLCFVIYKLLSFRCTLAHFCLNITDFWVQDADRMRRNRSMKCMINSFYGIPWWRFRRQLLQ